VNTAITPSDPAPAPLAHSAREGRPAQTYRAHVGAVMSSAQRFATEASAASPPELRDSFRNVVRTSATYHDLGKLDPLFQEDLTRNARSTRINHCDTGTAFLLKQRAGDAAMTAYSHHIGLPNFAAEKAKGVDFLRDIGPVDCSPPVMTARRSDQLLASILDTHYRALPESANAPAPSKTALSPLARRLALSCLVDADHSDTAQNYGNESIPTPIPLRAGKRLTALDSYVASLGKSAQNLTQRQIERRELRRNIYTACRNETLPAPNCIACCDSPVGTGKTTAVMAHLLRVAEERGLRRVFVVLPFTNIIDQSVSVYRRALTLPGESPEAAVAAHHHKANYSDVTLRSLASRWDAPIVVTTAVQFFESLSGHHPAALRKLHSIARSAIFVDEAHGAVPVEQWPQIWRWLRELTEQWGCHFVLGSGSLIRFWELPHFVPQDNRGPVADLVPSALRQTAYDYERDRILIHSAAKAFSLSEISDEIVAAPGPRLVIFNTVQSAAVVADYLRRRFAPALNVFHLSTALTPTDRAFTLAAVTHALKQKFENWVLVATSCVEAGVDFSFRSGFRESAGLVNLLQAAGRVNREYENEHATIFDFAHDGAGGLTIHPAFKLTRRVLAEQFAASAVNPLACTAAFRRTLDLDAGVLENNAHEICRAEKDWAHRDVTKLMKVITADTRTVVVDRALIERLENPDPKTHPAWNEMMLGSIQLWGTKLDSFAVRPIRGSDELHAWTLGYDSFLGIMAGILPILDQERLNGASVV
jgi:CRISPR-associated endonuclease/helicase Cas3